MKRVCSGPWKTPTVNWDGQITVCCRDNKLELSPGNLREKSFDQLWFGKKMDELRLAHVRGNTEKYEICRQCPGHDYNLISDQEVLDYLLAAGHRKEVLPFLRRVNSPLYDEIAGKIRFRARLLSPVKFFRYFLQLKDAIF